MTKELLKLHLGCGQKYLRGYVNIDFPQSEHTLMKVKADIYKDIRELEYDSGSIDEIRSHHVLEHFSRQEALKLLLQWRRWLKPGGLLCIETPDFAACAKSYKWAGLKRRFELGRHLFGSQEAKWAFHLDFWDQKKFQYVFNQLGFSQIKIKKFSNTLASRFPRVPFLNMLGNILPNSFYKRHGDHKLPSIIVSAIKIPLEIDEHSVLRRILSNYLVGNENDRLLDIWLKDIGY